MIPDVRVPVTAETLQQIANGEDVVLAAAEKVVSEPQGAGVTPSGPPEIASPEAAASAFSAGTSFLEDLAREKYDAADYAPGVRTYTIQLAETDSVIWAYYWCAMTTDILNENFENIDLKFVLDGDEISLDRFKSDDLENSGQKCRIYYTLLSKWPAGEHRLSTTSAFKISINDGDTDYEAGDYISEYSVYLKP